MLKKALFSLKMAAILSAVFACLTTFLPRLTKPAEAFINYPSIPFQLFIMFTIAFIASFISIFCFLIINRR